MIPFLFFISESNSLSWQEVKHNIGIDRPLFSKPKEANEDEEFFMLNWENAHQADGYTTYDGYNLLNEHREADIYEHLIFNESATKINLRCSSNAGAMFYGKMEAPIEKRFPGLERTPSYRNIPTFEIDARDFLYQKEVVCKPGLYCIWDKSFEHEMGVNFTKGEPMGYWMCGNNTDVKRFELLDNENEKDRVDRIESAAESEKLLLKYALNVYESKNSFSLLATKIMDKLLNPKTQKDFYGNQWWFQRYLDSPYTEITENKLKMVTAERQRVTAERNVQKKKRAKKDARDICLLPLYRKVHKKVTKALNNSIKAN